MVDSGDDWSVRGTKYPAAQCKQLQTKELHERITSSSTAAMNLLGLESNVLAANDPLNWNDIPSFQQTAALVKSLKVVNQARIQAAASPFGLRCLRKMASFAYNSKFERNLFGRFSGESLKL